jgi:outer membrane protein assembly factor BamE (lipoprotein component of BamABCDE complex)
MRHLTLILLTFLMGCMNTADGPFQLIRGRAIDYDAVDRFVENETTRAQAVAVLGAPAETANVGDNETLKYIAVKQRESISKVAGVRVSRSKQTMEEQVTLTFSAGTLVRKEKTSVVN